MSTSSHGREPFSISATIDRLDYNVSQNLAILRMLDTNSKFYKILNTVTKAFEILGSSATTIPLTLIAAVYLHDTQAGLYFYKIYPCVLITFEDHHHS